MKNPSEFQWQRYPEAERFVDDLLNKCCQNHSLLRHLQYDLSKHTSTQLFDWVDYLQVGYSSSLEKEFERLGYTLVKTLPSARLFYHPGAQLPMLLMHDESSKDGSGVAVSVESIADFLMVRGEIGVIEGSPLGTCRRCCVSIENHTSFWLIEKRGTRNIEPTYVDERYANHYLITMEKWQTRPRDLKDEDEAMSLTLNLVEEIIKLIEVDSAASMILDCERRYWQARNTAGQIQKNRQDRLGMGWANHDHHTFRSSRRHFSSLVKLFEILGFHCRERFYAGEEAGWGAQVMENPNAKLVLFLDVDLAPHELEIDFAHLPLPELDVLGTVGLWCALHGDSILKAGMHHLEAQFLFDELTKDLGSVGIGMMEPFSSFSYLHQAFTAGEVWHVNPQRIEKLKKQGKISDEQAQKFLSYGAVGSHLENLQRKEGYKGFNQKNVSFIIKMTDPRTLKY